MGITVVVPPKPGSNGCIEGAWVNNDWFVNNGWFCINGWEFIINGATLGGSGLGGGTPIGFAAALGKGGMAGGVRVFKDAKREGGRPFGTSYPRSFKLISLQAIENSLMSILPSASVSARALST